jgi:uncharacterized protein (DUF58 family)
VNPWTAGQERRGPWFTRWLGVPTLGLVGGSLIPLGLSLGVPFVRELWIPVVALDVVLALVVLADLLAAGGRLRVERSFAPVQAVGRPFPVQLRVANIGRRGIVARFVDAAPGTAEGLPAAATLSPREVAEASYTVTVGSRGNHPFGPVVVRILSPLRLWERQRVFDVPGTARVYPDFARLRETGFRGRLSEHRAPGRARRRPGGESEFQRLRPYQAGDPYRHIDWKATARRREFVTREYGQESNQNLIFLLDCGRMMSERSEGLSSFDHALNGAVLLGQVALRHGDRVGLLAFDRGIRSWLPPRGGQRSAGRLIRATYDLEPSTHDPDYAMAFRWLSQHVRRRSLVVVLTAVLDEVNGDLAASLVRGLATRHLPVCVWMRDLATDELLHRPATSLLDTYVRGAAAEVVGWRERELAQLRRRGALVLDVPAGELTASLFHRYLEIKARRLL